MGNKRAETGMSGLTVEYFQLRRASEPPEWDLYRRASSASVRTPGRIKAQSRVLISDADYDSGFLRKAPPLLVDTRSAAGDVCCIP